MIKCLLTLLPLTMIFATEELAEPQPEQIVQYNYIRLGQRLQLNKNISIYPIDFGIGSRVKSEWHMFDLGIIAEMSPLFQCYTAEASYLVCPDWAKGFYSGIGLKTGHYMIPYTPSDTECTHGNILEFPITLGWHNTKDKPSFIQAQLTSNKALTISTGLGF